MSARGDGERDDPWCDGRAGVRPALRGGVVETPPRDASRIRQLAWIARRGAGLAAGAVMLAAGGALLCMSAALPARAQDTKPAGAQTGNMGAKAAPDGARIASAGAGGAAACASCHGAAGEGNPQAAFPRIAGLPRDYLWRQLSAYADGSRQNPVMQPIASALSAAERVAVAGFYSMQQPKAAAVTPGQQRNAGSGGASASEERGRLLAEVGDESRQVQACANCHGPGGRGRGPIYPALAGQNEAYLAAALAEWKSGARRTDPSGQMPGIAQRLAAEDMTAVARYYAGLPAPMADGLRRSSPADVAAPAIKPAAGAKGSRKPAGVGVEQGSPTTGGGQSQGSGGGTQPGTPGQR